MITALKEKDIWFTKTYTFLIKIFEIIRVHENLESMFRKSIGIAQGEFLLISLT